MRRLRGRRIRLVMVIACAAVLRAGGRWFVPGTAQRSWRANARLAVTPTPPEAWSRASRSVRVGICSLQLLDGQRASHALRLVPVEWAVVLVLPGLEADLEG